MDKKDLGSLLSKAKRQRGGIVEKLKLGQTPDYSSFNDTIVGILAFCSDRNMSLNLFVRRTLGEADALMLGINYGSFYFTIPWEVLETISPENTLKGVIEMLNSDPNYVSVFGNRDANEAIAEFVSSQDASALKKAVWYYDGYEYPFRKKIITLVEGGVISPETVLRMVDLENICVYEIHLTGAAGLDWYQELLKKRAADAEAFNKTELVEP